MRRINNLRFTDKDIEQLAKFVSLLIDIDKKLKKTSKANKACHVKQQKIENHHNSPKKYRTVKQTYKTVLYNIFPFYLTPTFWRTPLKHA